MVQVPNNFVFSSEQSVKSYNYLDLASGVGYKTFYANGGADSTGLTYFLSSNTYDGDIGNFETTVVAGTTTLTFDVEFNVPAIVESADSFINYTTSTSGASSGYVTFTVSHVRGVTVTSLGSVQSVTDTSTSNNYRHLIKLALTRKAFAIGDKLRFTCAITRSSGTYILRHESGGRLTMTETGSGLTIDGTLKLDIPFKIDL